MSTKWKKEFLNRNEIMYEKTVGCIDPFKIMYIFLFDKEVMICTTFMFFVICSP